MLTFKTGHMLFAVLFISINEIFAQQLVNLDKAPPPVLSMTDAERARILESRDIKERFRITMELAANRLAHAEALSQSEKFSEATDELGAYQAIIDDLVNALKPTATKKPDNKSRELFRKLEINLRKDSQRIEAIRRVTPMDYSDYIKLILSFVSNARTDALNAFFGQQVLNDMELSEAPSDINASLNPISE
jgi:hypothetical protein